MQNNIDTQLTLALNTEAEPANFSEELFVGFNPENNIWQLLIRYAKDISDLAEKYNISIIYLLGGYAIISIDSKYIEAFAKDPRILYVDKPKYIANQVSYAEYASCITSEIKNKMGLSGEGVIVGVIDSGIDIMHKEFLENSSSRILYLWDQTAEYDLENPNEYKYGRIYNNEEINNAIADNINISEDTSGHGTGVTGIACGTNIGVANKAYIISVKLSSEVNRPNSLGLVMGVDFCIRKSRELNIPIAINLSYGNNYGSHKGNSLIENYINDVGRMAKCSIITGTGNEGITGRHVSGTLGNVTYKMIDIAVGDYVTSYNIQIWKNYQDIFDVVLYSPSGESLIYLSERQPILNTSYKGNIINSIYGIPNHYNRGQEIYISISSAAYVESGIWRVVLYPKSIINGEYNAYLPVTTSSQANLGFLNPSEYGTLTIPSTAEGLISVAAYNQNYDDYAYFSGRGYTANNQIKPDIAAPGVDIYTSYPGGSYQLASGTSIAAPFVTGSAVLLMEWGILQGNDAFLYGEKLKAALIRGARQLAITDVYPNEYIGWGALCLRNSLK
ncbi:MAG: S8 family peptidase [Coprococcus sp.]